MQALLALRAHRGHEFWPDSISICEVELVDPERLSGHAQITDSYLLALAGSQGGKLATMDKRLVRDAVRGGASLIESL